MSNSTPQYRIWSCHLVSKMGLLWGLYFQELGLSLTGFWISKGWLYDNHVLVLRYSRYFEEVWSIWICFVSGRFDFRGFPNRLRDISRHCRIIVAGPFDEHLKTSVGQYYSKILLPTSCVKVAPKCHTCSLFLNDFIFGSIKSTTGCYILLVDEDFVGRDWKKWQELVWGRSNDSEDASSDLYIIHTFFVSWQSWQSLEVDLAHQAASMSGPQYQDDLSGWEVGCSVGRLSFVRTRISMTWFQF